MARRLRKRLAIGVAVTAVLAGLTAAVVMAAQPAAHHHHRSAAARAAVHQRTSPRLAAAAAYLDVSPEKLRAALRAARHADAGHHAASASARTGRRARALSAVLANAVKAGTITQAQAGALLSQFEQHAAHALRAHHKHGKGAPAG